MTIADSDVFGSFRYWHDRKDDTENFYSNSKSRVRVCVAPYVGMDGTFDEVLERLNGYKNSAGDLEDLYFDMDYSDGTLSLFGYRSETDEEFNSRLEYIKNEKETSRIRDLEHLEELKKRLGVS